MTTPELTYAPGHAPAQVLHHAWRTAENSAAHLLPHLQLAAAQTPHLKLLDVGCGPSTISASLAKYLPPDGHVTATDISDAILAQAKAHAVEQGVARNMTFQKADVYHLPFADGTFDIVHAHQVLCHLSRPVDAVREMVRVVKRGGVVALREADMGMWAFWPEMKELERFREVMAGVLVANGGWERAGRMLVGWVMQAGVLRRDVKVGFGTWCYGEEEDRRAWGEAMIERLRTGQMRSKGIEMGITTEGEVDGMIEAWKQWIATDEATLGIMNGEVIVHTAC